MRTKLQLAASLFAIAAATFISTGCNTQPDHPNQINSFDGATYDTFTLAHGALTSLRAQISSTYPQYASQFNAATAAYSTALDAYALYRTAATTGNQAQLDIEIQNLAASIVVLENAFAADLHVSATSVQQIRKKAKRIRSAAGSNVSITDILTELEIAASIAELVPPAQPYAALAAMVIAATDAALNAEEAAAGQPIDLSTIPAIAPIQ
jgi:hypothetical protein